MMIKNGDLPAVPVWCDNSEQQLYGLTKREQFAAMAMQGLLSTLTKDDDLTPRQLAMSAILNADALLAELERTKGE